MIQAELYDYEEQEYGVYYFDDISELTDYLTDNTLTLIWKREV